jgi:hypothetical protein|tara:strand:- start:68 stop:307 length:240 start_codon:yes stop_codon:yes gene_type:complete
MLDLFGATAILVPVMTNYYDDNFGCWDGMDDPDTVDFYNQVQSESVEKTCSICGFTVWLRPNYDKCDSCCTKIENGWDC